ncbi:MarR family transcriptional regulator [Ancylobacter vacuolatus]|jgi:DNA-binding MarR family transcriptional regulator|uniref:MarR family transcriptional regulator n=1 Tax=Ancylobacter vacuolatus TaxID=223389 RepID=UPI000F8087E4|nr:MarR family transcriptional regulator [Ancylobacter aquaticus]
MPSPYAADTPLKTLIFVAKLMDCIVEDEREGETASHRLKQAGIMSYIYMMHLNGEKITVSKLKDRLNAPRQVIVELFKSLEDRGLLTHSTETHDGGRGRVFVYALADKALSL